MRSKPCCYAVTSTWEHRSVATAIIGLWRRCGRSREDRHACTSITSRVLLSYLSPDYRKVIEESIIDPARSVSCRAYLERTPSQVDGCMRCRSRKDRPAEDERGRAAQLHCIRRIVRAVRGHHTRLMGTSPMRRSGSVVSTLRRVCALSALNRTRVVWLTWDRTLPHTLSALGRSRR